MLDAIATALDQNPADATALCSAWEKVQSVIDNHPPILVAHNGIKEFANDNGHH